MQRQSKTLCMADIKHEKVRSANWDLLRSLSMFFVVCVHSCSYVGPVFGFETKPILWNFFLICDPIFFMLSGFFAIKPLKGDLKSYYYRKAVTILFPLIVYSLILYLYKNATIGLSVGGWLNFLLDLLLNGWWFVPALLPSLAVAPFLYKCLSSLSDKQIATLTTVVAILAARGFVLPLCTYIASRLEIETAVALVSVFNKLIPASLLTGFSYCQFFVLGYLFKRTSVLFAPTRKKFIVLIGLLSWFADLLFTHLGIERSDPSFFWLFLCYAIFLVFGGLRVPTAFNSAITWVGKRSFSIYLLQFTTIELFSIPIYWEQRFGNPWALQFTARFMLWFAIAVAAFVVALLLASLIDTMLIGPLQNRLLSQLNGIVKNPLEQTD